MSSDTPTQQNDRDRVDLPEIASVSLEDAYPGISKIHPLERSLYIAFVDAVRRERDTQGSREE